MAHPFVRRLLGPCHNLLDAFPRRVKRRRETGWKSHHFLDGETGETGEIMTFLIFCEVSMGKHDG